MNGIYHKLGSLKNGHYEWESRFAGHIGTYTLYYESTTDKTWVISGPSGKLILTDLEHFFEPLTELTKATLAKWTKLFEIALMEEEKSSEQDMVTIPTKQPSKVTFSNLMGDKKSKKSKYVWISDHLTKNSFFFSIL